MARPPAEQPPEGSLRRNEVVAELARRGLAVSVDMLRYWHGKRRIPSPTRYGFPARAYYAPETVAAIAAYAASRIPWQSMVCPHCGESIVIRHRPHGDAP